MLRGRSVSVWALASCVALAASTSACVAETRFGASASTGGGGGPVTYTPAPAPAPLPNTGGGSTPQPQPQPAPPQNGARHVSIRHATPTGTVVTTHVPVRRDTGLFGNGDATSALKGLVYFIPNDTMKMPDVSTMTPQALVYTNQLQIATRDYQEGIAGTNRSEFYAIQYTGNFTVSKPGTYSFALDSTDGSLLYIDGKLVVNNDNRHTPKKTWGAIDLQPGAHAIRVDYFKAFRWTVELVLDVIPPGGTEVPWQSRM